ncbi:MAG TPA: FAD-dependent oxidoreductase [bacterium]|nr:FAD-dependent oxidoreductase [bacterium]
MAQYTYLIVGGGMTADAAVRGVREVDRAGSIGMLSAEAHPPYNRPPLTKGLWKGQPEGQIWRGTEEHDGHVHLNRRAVQLDPNRHTVTDDQGEKYRYEKLLLATGGTPRRLPFGGDRFIYYRGFDDYRRLRELTDRGRRFAVIGGGFIGSEIAAALAMNGQSVVMLFPEEGIGARIFPSSLSRFLNDYYREKGVEVRAGEAATGFEGKGPTGGILRTKEGATIEADAVIAGIGIEPNVELARAAGLRVEDGVVVDEHLRTSRPEIFAAGDVASFPNPALGRLRVEHEDNANTMGTMAGRNMAGRDEPYRHLPFFYSDLFDLGYEAVGQFDSRLQTVEDWKEPFREGVIYYLRDGRVRAVLLWNVWEQVEHARALIAEQRTFTPKDLKGRLPA